MDSNHGNQLKNPTKLGKNPIESDPFESKPWCQKYAKILLEIISLPTGKFKKKETYPPPHSYF